MWAICSVQTGRLWVSASTHRISVAVCGCPSAHTRRLWLSLCDRVCLWVSASTHRTFVAVRGCLSAHTRRPCVSVSTHRTFVCVHVCPSAHTGRPWLSISTHTARWSLDSARWPFPWTVWVILAHVGCLFSTHRTSVGVRQHTLNVRGCPWLSVSTHKTSLAVRLCPCVSVSIHRTPVAVHQCTYQHAGPWTQHAGPSHGLFR